MAIKWTRGGLQSVREPADVFIPKIGGGSGGGGGGGGGDTTTIVQPTTPVPLPQSKLPTTPIPTAQDLYQKNSLETSDYLTNVGLPKSDKLKIMSKDYVSELRSKNSNTKKSD